MRRFKRFVLPAVFLLLGAAGSCKRKGFDIAGFWDMSRDGDPAPTRFEFSGTESAGTVLETGALPAYQDHTYTVVGIQVTIKFHYFHGIGWSRSTYTGMIDEKEERMDGAYAGQSGGAPGDPVQDFSGTWAASKVHLL